MRSSTRLLVAAIIPTAWGQFQLFQNGTVDNSTLVPLTAACVNAIQGTLQCPTVLQDIAASDYYFGVDSGDYSSICTKTCNTSLASYHSSVVKACAGQQQPWAGYSANYFGDLLWSAFNYTCLTDPKTGKSCMSYFSNISDTYTNDITFGSMSKTDLCSGCTYSLWQFLQSTAYSFYDSVMASQWSAIQQECGVTYPTAVQPRVANVTNIPGFAPANYTVASCLSGSTYTVASGDNCVSISKAKKVSTGALINLNSLLPDCSNLLGGASLCLPQSCTTYSIASGDTCSSITTAKNITLTQLMAWNPTIDTYCDNLISGQNICVGLPGTAYNGTTIAGASVTKTAVYATATVSPPSNVAHGTTAKCGKYYTVQTGDDCSNIALNQTISIILFENINPSINSNCTNLTPGLAYCVEPTADWNSTDSSTATTTSTYVSAPAPTASGTTPNCYQYHTVVSGDYCGLLEQQYGITFAQLQLWNPSLDASCGNLILGDAYCVAGNNPATTTGATGTAAVATS